MTNTYYYLIASLPTLVLDRPSPLTRKEFLLECKKWLSLGDYSMVASVAANDLHTTRHDPPVVAEWKAYNRALRRKLSKARQNRKESTKGLAGDSLKSIFEEPTPLAMEQRIERMRWEFIDESEFGHHFDCAVLILYFLRLQILERLAIFDKTSGRDIFERLTEVEYA